MTNEPRIVEEYRGCQIIDARDKIRLRFTEGRAPRRIQDTLRTLGFKHRPDGQWERPHTTDSIMQARAIAATFYEKGKS